MYEFAKSMFTKSLDFHIRLMKLDYIKHQFTADLYQFYFDLAHDLGEKNEAMNRPVIENDDCEAMIDELYRDAEDTKNALAWAISMEKNEWAKNLLIGKLDSFQQLCAKLESLLEAKESLIDNDTD